MLSVLNVFWIPIPVVVISYTFAISVPTAFVFNAYVVTSSPLLNFKSVTVSNPFTNLLLFVTIPSTWSFAFGSHIAISFIVLSFVDTNISFCVAVDVISPLYNASPTLNVFCNPDASSPIYVLSTEFPSSIIVFLILSVNTCAAEFIFN